MINIQHAHGYCNVAPGDSRCFVCMFVFLFVCLFLFRLLLFFFTRTSLSFFFFFFADLKGIVLFIARSYRPTTLREQQRLKILTNSAVKNIRATCRWRTLHIWTFLEQKANSFSSHWHSILKYTGLLAVGALVVRSKISHAHCGLKLSHKSSSHRSKKKDKDGEKSQPKFDFREFWNFLWPDIWLLLLASLSAFAVAMVNIELPLLLGNLVNAVSSLTGGNQNIDIFQVLKEPAMKLISIYGAQSVLTFAYISFLSCLGERLAERMRNALFASLIRQDIAFFDDHKTGELVNRYVFSLLDTFFLSWNNEMETHLSLYYTTVYYVKKNMVWYRQNVI